jgi:hypothetical protein
MYFYNTIPIITLKRIYFSYSGQQHPPCLDLIDIILNIVMARKKRDWLRKLKFIHSKLVIALIAPEFLPSGMPRNYF